MPDTRAIASLNRRNKSDEDRSRWAIEQAIAKGPANPPGMTIAQVLEAARAIEDYVTGRTTT